MPGTGGRPSRAAAAALTLKIVDAAIDLFSENGFAPTTIEDIAAACATTPRSIVRRFATKDDLLVAAVPRFAERMSEFRARKGSESGDVMARLEAMLRFLIDIARLPNLRSFFLICANEVRRVPGLSKQMEATERAWEAELASLFAEAQEQGSFTGLNTATLATVSIASLLSYPFIFYEMGLERLGEPASADAFFTDIYALLLRLK